MNATAPTLRSVAGSTSQLGSQLNVSAMVAKIACIIFFCEAAIMLALTFLPIENSLLEGVFDSTTLTVLASPLIYRWVAYPFATAADNARAELSLQLDQTRWLLIQNEKLRSSLQQSSEATAEIHEKVLQKIGADLHDGTAQLLTFASLKTDRLLPAITAFADPNKLRDWNDLRNVIRDSLREVRGMSTDLSLPELHGTGVKEAIELSVQRHEAIAESKIDVKFSGIPKAVPLAHNVCAYRFVQEALSNAHKHSKAGNIHVKCEFGDDIVVSVIDDGVGFDLNNGNKNGLGLLGMRSRVQAIGGVLDVATTIGVGTRVTAHFSSATLDQKAP